MEELCKPPSVNFYLYAYVFLGALKTNSLLMLVNLSLCIVTAILCKVLLTGYIAVGEFAIWICQPLLLITTQAIFPDVPILET